MIKRISEKYRIEQVTQWTAKDGSLHDTFDAAVRHTTDHELAMWLDAWFEENTAHQELVATANDLARDLKKIWTFEKKEDS
jgi:hypothetical protein